MDQKKYDNYDTIEEHLVIIERKGNLCDVWLFGKNSNVSVKNLHHKNETDVQITRRAKLIFSIYSDLKTRKTVVL